MTTVELVSQDGQRLVVDSRCIPLLGIFKSTISPDALPPTLSLSTVNSPVLVKLAEWLEFHKLDTESSGTKRAETLSNSEEIGDEQEGFSESSFEEEEIKHENGSHLLNSRRIQKDQMAFEEETAWNMVMTPWDRTFFKELDLGTLIELTKVHRTIFHSM
jgi:Skp1 family protein with oligomerisation domain